MYAYVQRSIVVEVDVKAHAPLLFFLIQWGRVSQLKPASAVATSHITQRALEIPVSVFQSENHRQVAMLTLGYVGFCEPEFPPPCLHSRCIDHLAHLPCPGNFTFGLSIQLFRALEKGTARANVLVKTIRCITECPLHINHGHKAPPVSRRKNVCTKTMTPGSTDFWMCCF